MADITLSIADSGGFIPQVWAQRALDILRSNIVLAPLVTQDSDWEPGWQGKQLNIPYPGTFVAQTKTADSPATVQTPSGATSVAVTLTTHNYVDFIVEDVAQAQASSNLLDRYVSPAIIALGNAVEDALITAGLTFTGNVGTYGTDLSAASVRTVQSTLDTQLAPIAPRHMVISPKDRTALLGDATLATYFAYAQAGSVGQGAVPELYGLQLHMSQRMPVVVNTPNQTKGIAFHPEGLMLVTRPFLAPPANSGVQVSTIQDVPTGLFLRVLYQYDINARGVRVGFDILYGCIKLRNELGLLIKS